MNTKNKYGVAIDIGATKVSVIVGESLEGDRMKIIAGSSQFMPEDAIRRGEIENVSSVRKTIRKAIKTIEDEDGIRILRAAISISSQHVSYEEIEESVYVKVNDEITGEDMDALMDNVARVKPKDDHFVINVSPISYNVDGGRTLLSPIGAAGNRLFGKFGILYGDNGKLLITQRAMLNAGVEISTMVPYSHAAAEATVSEEEMELGVCVVDIGATTTELAIYNDSLLRYTASLPYGASLINSDIKSYGILQRSVEKLKTEYGIAVSDNSPADTVIEIPSISSPKPKHIPQRTLSRIIESRMTEIVRDIKELIIASGYEGKIPEGIVLTGGGAKLKFVDRLFTKITGFETRIGVPDTKIDGINNDIIFDTRYSTVLGTLLKELKGEGGSKIEFLSNSSQMQTPEASTQPEVVKDSATTQEEGTAEGVSAEGVKRKPNNDFYLDPEEEDYDELETEEKDSTLGGFFAEVNKTKKALFSKKTQPEFDFEEDPEEDEELEFEDEEPTQKEQETKKPKKGFLKNLIDNFIKED